MGALEIIVLVAGGIVFVLSFLLPVSKEEVSNETKELAREEIKALVSHEMESVRSHVDDVVDEAVGYAVEKTERSLERLTNEKIMAVNEYSDTVMQEIHKNHEEAMFLYDMLNSKHTNLKNTVSEVNRTVKEAEETKKEAEAVVNSFQRLQPEAVSGMSVTSAGAVAAPKTGKDYKPAADTSEAVDISFMQDEDGQAYNSNEKILELYSQGKSNVAIAKELGLGVGEVKLVIDLFRNM